MCMSVFKKIILLSILFVQCYAGHEHDDALSQFLSHTHFREVKIVNQLEDIQEMDVRFIQWRQVKPGQNIPIRGGINQKVVYNGTAYTSDFMIRNDDPAKGLDVCLDYWLLLTPVPQTPIKLSMLKSIKRRGSSNFQYKLTLPEEHEYNPMEQTQPLIIELVRAAAPLLTTLMPCDQERLRAINIPMPAYTSYFRDGVLPHFKSSDVDYHELFQQSYNNN